MDYSDISVVIQGQIYGKHYDNYEKRYTYQVCESVRKVMPGAEIIVSTWSYCDTEDLDYDILVKIPEEEDPGNVGNNFNRQMMTTLRGIEKATRKYVLKIRSETIVVNNNFAKIYERYEELDRKCTYHFLRSRLVVDGIMPTWSGEYFDMSDHLFFGLKEDVIELWTLPPVKEGEFLYPGNKTNVFLNPHRYLPLRFVQKYIPVEYDNPTDINHRNKIIWEKVIAENFISVEAFMYGTFSLKYHQNRKLDYNIPKLMEYYTLREWQRLYKKHCNHSYRPDRRNAKELFSHVYAVYFRLRKKLSYYKTGLRY